MEVWQDHRTVQAFTDVVGTAIPKHKTKHTPTHIALPKDGIPICSPYIVHCLSQQVTLESSGVMGFCGALWRSGVPQELLAPALCSWGVLLLLYLGTTLHIPSCCPWFSGLSQPNGTDLTNHWVLLLGRCLVVFSQCCLNNETILSHSVMWCCQVGCPSNSMCGGGTSPQ